MKMNDVKYGTLEYTTHITSVIPSKQHFGYIMKIHIRSIHIYKRLLKLG